jgi:hypothetical protein
MNAVRTLAARQHRAPAVPRPRASGVPVEADEPPALTTCSVWLRVRTGSGWVEAEQAIRKLRSFELTEPPRLKAALCDGCVRSLRARRDGSAELLAA